MRKMITIIGSGKFGQAISKLLGKNEHQLVDVESNLAYSNESKTKIKQANKLIIVVPSAALQACITMIKPLVAPKTKILNCTKGIFENLITPPELLKSELDLPVATFAGPNLAKEIMLNKPAMAVIAGENSEEWAKLFRSENFGVVIGEDAAGVAYSAAMKNILALGVGIIHGYYGENCANAQGSLTAYAYKEVRELYHNKTKKPMPHIAFIGDLLATATSEKSRNHTYGHKVGVALASKEQVPKAQGTIEGVRTLKMVSIYANKNRLQLPTLAALYKVLFQSGQVKDIIASWN